jgi:N-acetylneuraminic acid mutarotase
MKSILFSAFLLLPFLPVLLPGQAWAQSAGSASWHALEEEGEAQERHENALVKVGNKIVLLGGRGMKALDIYDTREKTWSRGSMPPLEIHHMQAVSLHGLVYVMGAFTGAYPYETPLSHILIYDPLLDTWAVGPEIPEDRRRGAAGVVTYKDKIYVVNGIINGHTSGWVQWLDEYDPATNKWQKLPDAPRARDHVHAAVIDDKLYVAGGRRSGYSSETFATTVKETNVFDYNSRQWRELPSPEGDIPTARAGAAVAVYQGKLLVMGGESDEQELAHNEVEGLDTGSGSWQKLSPLSKGRHGTQAVYFDDIVIIGAGSGNRGGGPELNSFEILAAQEDPAIPDAPLVKGEIAASIDTVVFNRRQKGERRIEIENRKGNQALLISYILADNADFEVNPSQESPFILLPGQRLPLEISYKGKKAKPGQNQAQEALLLIKTLGNSAPLSIPLIIVR